MPLRYVIACDVSISCRRPIEVQYFILWDLAGCKPGVLVDGVNLSINKMCPRVHKHDEQEHVNKHQTCINVGRAWETLA